MKDAIFLYGAFIVMVANIVIYFAHIRRPEYKPLKREGLLYKGTGAHLLQAIGRKNSDPLKKIQMKIGYYGLRSIIYTLICWILLLMIGAIF